MNDKSREYNQFFSETYALFKNVTAYAVLLEKIDENQVEVASINELRGVLYHLYGYLDEKQEDDKAYSANYIEAIEHLHRAYFDLFSSICTILIEKIYNFSVVYPIEVISELYPLYFQEIIPDLYSLFEDISHVRSKRKIEGDPLKSLEKNHEIVIKLMGWYKTLTSLTDLFEKKKSQIEHKNAKEKNKNKLDIFLRFAIPLIMFILGYLLSHPSNSAKPESQKATNKIIKSPHK
jgi:hypothetical protein